jgi:hypothetical protein
LTHDVNSVLEIQQGQLYLSVISAAGEIAHDEDGFAELLISRP